MKKVFLIWFLIAFLFLGQIFLYAFDFIAGVPPTISSCDPDSEYIGLKELGTSYDDGSADFLHCLLRTPSCSGPLNTAYIYHNSTDSQTSKVYVYTDDGDSTPDSGDTLLDTTNTISSSSVQWASGAMNSTANVSTGTNYWVCRVGGTTWDYKFTTSPGQTMYYREISGSFDSAPGTLAGTWSTSTRNQNVYITIGD